MLCPSEEEKVHPGSYRKARIVPKPVLSEEDERILTQEGITVTEHLGEGFFGNVWKGRYATGNIDEWKA